MIAPGSLNIVQVALKEMLVDMGKFKYTDSESVNAFSSQRLTLIWVGFLEVRFMVSGVRLFPI